MLTTVTTIAGLHAALKPWRAVGESIGFVPTMGALHKGHMALVDASKKSARRTVAYIFVNPTQFAPNEDLAKYPRTLEADKKLLTEAGCDLLYTPEVGEIYPEGFTTTVDPGPLATILEGAFRPGHFAGVATVVTKMLLQVLPDKAFFGEKDYQQLLVIRGIVRDLNIPVEIIGVPIVRDTDGLALSSRNAYLSPEDRQRAASLPRIMNETAASILKGDDIEKALDAGRSKLEAAGFTVDYLELADAANLAPLRKFNGAGRLLVAARIGGTRLIDNVSLIKTTQ